MRIVVTGALGHIGSRLIRDLAAEFPGAGITLIDDLSTQRYASLFDLPGKACYKFLELDVAAADLELAFEGADAVIHLAALTDAVASFGREGQVDKVNVLGTERVARACARVGSALLFASTTSVYGSAREEVDEDCPAADLVPQSPYAESKLKAEGILHSLAGELNLRHVICRMGTVFGVSPGMRFHTAVNRFCWQAAAGQPLTVWRTAMEQKRPYLDLADAVRALTFLLRRRQYGGDTYNLVTLNATVGQIVESIRASVPELSVNLVDAPIMNQLSYRVANRRFAGLGFDFRGDLGAGIEATIALLRAAGGRQSPRPV